MINMNLKVLATVFMMMYMETVPVLAQALQRISFKEYEAAMAKDSKPAFIFIKTEWCSYCKRIDHSTLMNKSIIKSLNNDFYFIELDGESESEITFLSHTYKYKATGKDTGVHELAEELGTINRVLAYPTIVLFNKELEIVYRKAGYISAKQLTELINLALKL